MNYSFTTQPPSIPMQVFFYGLFMDDSILKQKGLSPSAFCKARLEDYTLKIGTRASLIPEKGAVAHGILMAINRADLDHLYAEPSVADYLPEEVEVITGNNEKVRATCYNLPEDALAGTNATYAAALLQLARELEFPEDYLEHIKQMS